MGSSTGGPAALSLLEVPAKGRGAEHRLSYSRIYFFSLLAATVREGYRLHRVLTNTHTHTQILPFCTQGFRLFQKLETIRYHQAPIPNRRKVNINLFLIFNFACAVSLPVVVFLRFANDSSTDR